MQLRSLKRQVMDPRRWVLVGLCAFAIACDPTDALDDEAGPMVGAGGSDANTSVSTSDSASPVTTGDAGVAAPGNPGGSSAGGGTAGGGTAGGGTAGGGIDSGSAGGGDAGGSTDLDGGALFHDTGTGGVMVGPSVRRDGGPTRYDPDAAGPILNAEAHAACMTLVDNICTHSTDCEEMLGALPAERRAQVLESCKNSFLRAHNCNRAIATASGFAACSEGTKTIDCLDVFGTEIGSSCVDQLTFQP